jgi:hypothetical protein
MNFYSLHFLVHTQIILVNTLQVNSNILLILVMCELYSHNVQIPITMDCGTLLTAEITC